MGGKSFLGFVLKSVLKGITSDTPLLALVAQKALRWVQWLE